MTAVEDLLKKQTQKHQEEAQTLVQESGSAVDEADSTTVQQQVDAVIASNTIVVFSKSYCPYCRQAKMALRSISNLDFCVIEMDDGAHDGWQAHVAQVAKASSTPETANNNTMSVPQIFIHQQYVGGAEDLADMYVDQRLATLLGRPHLS
jgi:glutaredoxin 3